MLNAPGWVKHWCPRVAGAERAVHGPEGRAVGRHPKTAETPGGRAAVLARASDMRAAAIDFGKVRIGLAVADELGMMAHPRPHLDARDRRGVFAALKRLADEENLAVFVVGLPRTLSGAEGPPARRARRFAEELSVKTGRRVEMIDEWLSTREARARLHEQGLDDRQMRDRIDSAAAAVLLQSWLDARARPDA